MQWRIGWLYGNVQGCQNRIGLVKEVRNGLFETRFVKNYVICRQVLHNNYSSTTEYITPGSPHTVLEFQAHQQKTEPTRNPALPLLSLFTSVAAVRTQITTTIVLVLVVLVFVDFDSFSLSSHIICNTFLQLEWTTVLDAEQIVEITS
jgi:hypothetical protein